MHRNEVCIPLYEFVVTLKLTSGFRSSLAGCVTKGDPTGVSNKKERQCKKKEKKLEACGYTCGGIQGICNNFIVLI